jgi:hypothetical protein
VLPTQTAIAALCLALWSSSGTVGAMTPLRTTTEVLRPATDAQVRAFLAQAESGLAGTFATSYSVDFGGRAKGGVTVYGAQLSHNVTMYRETPPVASLIAPGTKAPVSYEVFEVGPGGRRFAGVRGGFYSCTLRARRGRWACQGPYTGLGMGSTFELTAPYPPSELVRGLSNAAYYYLGLGGIGARASENAYLFTRRSSGHSWQCLGFGSGQRLDGTACLGWHGLVSYYSLPAAATSDTYKWAAISSVSANVPPSVWRLPARPSRVRD